MTPEEIMQRAQALWESLDFNDAIGVSEFYQAIAAFGQEMFERGREDKSGRVAALDASSRHLEDRLREVDFENTRLIRKINELYKRIEAAQSSKPDESWILSEIIEAVNSLPAYWVEENLISNLKKIAKKRNKNELKIG